MTSAAQPGDRGPEKNTGSWTFRPHVGARPRLAVPFSGPPVTVETNGTDVAAGSNPRRASDSSRPRTSICGPWRATSRESGCAKTPAERSSATIPSIAPGTPETIVCRGPFTAATENSPAKAANRSRTSSAGRPTAAVLPSPTIRPISRPRRQTIRKASARCKAPATCAAATSPRLWPTTASGTMPHDRQSEARATCKANWCGWANAGSSNRPPSNPRVSSSTSERPSFALNQRSHSS